MFVLPAAKPLDGWDNRREARIQDASQSILKSDQWVCLPCNKRNRPDTRVHEHTT